MTIIITISIIILDLISKYLISHNLELNESITLIDNFLNLTYVKNTGAAFSILSKNGLVVLTISLIIILGIIAYLSYQKELNKYEKISYSLILGGAIGNLTDRLLYGYVRDFIDINFLNINYPIFNLADIFVVLGVILLLFYTWRK